MLRSTRSRIIAAALICCAALLTWILMPSSADSETQTKAAPEASSQARPKGHKSERVRSPRAKRAAAPRRPIAPRRAPNLADEEEAEAEDEERVIAGMTAEERREKGFTPMRLFASRSGARVRALGLLMERLGHPELAQSMAELSEEFAVAHEVQDEGEVGWDDLMARQQEVLDEVDRVFASDESDTPFFKALAREAVSDVEDAMSGNLESVDRKLEEELSEDRNAKDEDGEVKGAEDGEVKGAEDGETGDAAGSDASDGEADEAEGSEAELEAGDAERSEAGMLEAGEETGSDVGSNKLDEVDER